jgi:hypothetical protein
MGNISVLMCVNMPHYEEFRNNKLTKVNISSEHKICTQVLHIFLECVVVSIANVRFNCNFFFTFFQTAYMS